MAVYLFILIAILFLWPILKYNRKGYSIVICSLLASIVIFRSASVGADTLTYMYRFIHFGKTSWNKVLSLADLYDCEYGFAILNKLIYIASKSSRIFIIIISLTSIILIGKRVYEEARYPWLSFFIFVTLGLHANALNILRQFLAVSIVFYSYRFLNSCSLSKYIVLVLLASTFHYSALIVLPMYWLVRVDYKKSIVGVVIGGAVFLNLYGKSVLLHFLGQTKYAHFLEEKDENGALGLLIISIVFFLLICVSVWLKGDYKHRNYYISFSLATVLISSLTFSFGIIERLLPYFTIVYLISIPNVLNEIKNNNARLYLQYLFLICVILLFYYLVIVCRVDINAVIPYKLWDGSF